LSKKLTITVIFNAQMRMLLLTSAVFHQYYY